MRLHLGLAVVLVLAVGACVHTGSATLWLGLGVYAASLLLHEAAHVLAAAPSRRSSRHDKTVDTVILGPLGGMLVPGDQADPRERVFVAMAGPVANLTLVVAAMCCLAGSGVELVGSLLFNPGAAFAGDGPATGGAPIDRLAPLVIAINWPLFLLNLAPATPFDGGVALRAWLGLWFGSRPARDVCCFVALLIAAGLLGAGGALVLAKAAPPLAGAGFAALALVIAFGARADAVDPGRQSAWDTPWRDEPFGPSLAALAPPTDETRSRFAPVAREPLTQNERIDLEESNEPHVDGDWREGEWDEGDLDKVLAKVHADGLSGLTANERALLERASARFQRRRRNDG